MKKKKQNNSHFSLRNHTSQIWEEGYEFSRLCFFIFNILIFTPKYRFDLEKQSKKSVVSRTRLVIYSKRIKMRETIKTIEYWNKICQNDENNDSHLHVHKYTINNPALLIGSPEIQLLDLLVIEHIPKLASQWTAIITHTVSLDDLFKALTDGHFESLHHPYNNNNNNNNQNSLC